MILKGGNFVLPPFVYNNNSETTYMIRLNIIILLSFFMLKCSNKDDDALSSFDAKYFTSGKLDPCDCNTKSVDLINRSIKIRKSFSGIEELKSNKKAKQHITKIAKVYVKLAEKCFEKNATQLFTPNDCNDVKYLEQKQNELFTLGIRLNQGAKVWK